MTQSKNKIISINKKHIDNYFYNDENWSVAVDSLALYYYNDPSCINLITCYVLEAINKYNMLFSWCLDEKERDEIFENVKRRLIRIFSRYDDDDFIPIDDSESDSDSDSDSDGEPISV